MSLVLEDIPVSEEDNGTNVVIIDDMSQVILLPDTSAATQFFLVPSTVSEMQTVPAPIITPPDGTKKEKPKENKLGPLYTCKTCNYTTSRLTYFEKHQRTHWVVKKNSKPDKNKGRIKESPPVKVKEPSLKCPDCNYFTSNYRSLRIHMHIHSKANAYRCQDCNYSGKNLAELIKHYKSTKKLYCKYCKFATHSKELLKEHKEKNHSPKWYGCMKCKFAAADQNDVAQHMIEKHRNAVRFNPVQVESQPEKPDQSSVQEDVNIEKCKV